ncbi:TrmB family transcriptional regulator sugar-binding domain-containing protein [Sporomusa acidovorans]|nr:TrmB family transcriptional regulator sugar-binding domain-containing protein [Sporomusa acidovorans]
MPLENFINCNIKKYKRINNYLLMHKDAISQNKYPNWLWQIQGDDNLVDKARELIDKAEKTILLSFWYEDGVNIQKQLEAAIKREVKVISNQMSERILPLGQVFGHESWTVVEKIHVSEFIMVVDDLYGMFAFKNQDQKVEGYYSFNQGVIRILDTYIRHDIYINRLLADFREPIIKKYGKDLEKLLNLFGD